MPITGRTPEECFDVFTGHVRPLVTDCLPTDFPLIAKRVGASRMTLSFRQGKEVAAPVDSEYGRIHVSLAQALEAVQEGERYRLSTVSYWYRIQKSRELSGHALFRWEYDAGIARHRHCRHHLHMPIEVTISGRKVMDLDKVHLPTGWVTIEEFLRFLIVDFGVVPPCGDRWPERLEESERAFYEDFTSKRYRAPAP